MFKKWMETIKPIVGEFENRVVETRFDPEDEKRVVDAVDGILIALMNYMSSAVNEDTTEEEMGERFVDVTVLFTEIVCKRFDSMVEALKEQLEEPIEEEP